jgi:stage V sporulation protein SpoVS
MIALSRKQLAWVALLIGSAPLTSTTQTQAGEQYLKVHFTNMTPDALSSDASKKCAAKVRGALLHDGIEVQAIGETALRKAVGAEDKSKGFMDWSPEQVKMALVAVDCRPEQKQLDVLFINGKVKEAHRVRGQELTLRRLNWFTRELVRHLWAGSSNQD